MSELFRTIGQADLTDAEVKGRLFRGFAAVFDSPWDDRLTKEMGYVERTARGAFRKALGLKADVPFLLGHDRNMLLGTTKSGNVHLSEEPKGLLVEAKLPDNHLGEYARTMIESGDIQGMSYGIEFNRRTDIVTSQERGVLTRTIVNARKLLDVSLTWEPAYASTSVELRSQGFVAIPLQETSEGEETQPAESGDEDQTPDEETAWWVEASAEAAKESPLPWWEIWARTLEKEK